MFGFRSAEDVLPLSEFRNNLSSCVDQTRRTGRPLLLTQNGRTAGVFLGAEQWDALQERLEKLAACEDVLAAEGEADRGDLSAHDDFMAEVRARRKARKAV